MNKRIKKKKQKQLDLINYWIEYRMISNCSMSNLYDTKESGVAIMGIEGKSGYINDLYVFYNGYGIIDIDNHTYACFSSINTARHMLHNFNLSNKDMKYIETHMIDPYFPIIQNFGHIHDDEYPHIRLHRFFDKEDLEDQNVWDELYKDSIKEKK